MLGRTVSLPAITHKMEVIFSSTAATFELSKTFANNLGTRQVFLKMTDVSFPAQPACPPTDPRRRCGSSALGSDAAHE